MKLLSLFKKNEILCIKGNEDVNICALSQKADKIVSNGLYFCVKGISGDGHNFVDIAKKNGCIALVVERFVDSNLPQILVKNVRKIMPMVCNRFYNDVLKELKLIGITGTNGKTTTTEIIYNMLLLDGKKVGLIGTNGVKFNENNIKTYMTTPDTVDLFYYFNLMCSFGIEYIVMEISAHAIYLNKIYGLKFEIGALTNISQDHLDFFKTMSSYAKSKLMFLENNYCKKVLINVDDNYGNLFSKLKIVNSITYGIEMPATNFACDIDKNLYGYKFLMNIFDNVFKIKLNLLGKFNIYNILLASSVAKLLGVSNKSIKSCIENLTAIPGRMNVFKLKNGATAVIDYAHSPDSLEKILIELKERCKGDLITVFGCGGNRDKGKREIMGMIASKYSNKVIITNDNPRFEKPLNIAKDILKGITEKYFLELDREKAIEFAYKTSTKLDIILIAGKGAEDYMEINGQKLSYSDIATINKYIKTKNK